MTKWLRDSGLKVNKSKNELCLFHRFDHHLDNPLIEWQLDHFKHLHERAGIMFDSKLNGQRNQVRVKGGFKTSSQKLFKNLFYVVKRHCRPMKIPEKVFQQVITPSDLQAIHKVVPDKSFWLDFP